MPGGSDVLTFVWWIVFTAGGIWAQSLVPGVDFLAAGLVVSLQLGGLVRTLWLAVCWIILLEGMGNLPFGYGIAWYGLLAAFYVVGRRFFESKSFLFICLLGLWLGAVHPVLIYSLCFLSGLQTSMSRVIMEGAVQAAVFPVVWLVADRFFPKELRRNVAIL